MAWNLFLIMIQLNTTKHFEKQRRAIYILLTKQELEQHCKSIKHKSFPIFYAISKSSYKKETWVKKKWKQNFKKDHREQNPFICISLLLLDMDPFTPGSPPSSPSDSISLASLVSGHTSRTASSFSTPGPSSRVSPLSPPAPQTGRSQLNAASDVSEGRATSGSSSSAGIGVLATHRLSVLQFLDLSGKAINHVEAIPDNEQVIVFSTNHVKVQSLHVWSHAQAYANRIFKSGHEATPYSHTLLVSVK